MHHLHKLARPIVLGALACCGLLVSGSLVASCDGGGEDDTTTTGKRVTLHTEVVLEGGPSFENAFGWQIELSKLLLSSGAIYYFDGHPIESAAISPARPGVPGTSTFMQLFAPGVAHAHPGHYDAGEARGEMLTASSFDLIAGPATLADGDGVSGVVRSARFTYNDPPTGPASADLGSHVVLLEGTATKGDMTKVFQLSGDRDDVLDAAKEPVVEGCTFDEVDIQAEGTVTLHVTPEEWLEQAEFDDVPDSEGGEPVVIEADNRAAKAFVRGIKKSSAFVFTYSSN